MMRVLAVFGVVVLLAACGGRQRVVEGGEAARVEALPTMMGSAEQQAFDLLEELTLTLQLQASDPDQAEARIDAFLRVNADQLLGCAEQIEATVAALSGAEKLVYEAQLSAFLEPALSGWLQAQRAFEQANPEQGARIRRAVAGLDQPRQTAAAE